MTQQTSRLLILIALTIGWHQAVQAQTTAPDALKQKADTSITLSTKQLAKYTESINRKTAVLCSS